jgi:Zn-dependent protease
VHELGHVFEARRQGVPVTLPTFIPGFGAFVTTRQEGVAPWRSALIALAGPFVGGLGAAAVWAVGSAHDTTWLVVLANIGFLLNAFNLLPIGFLDGGTVVRSISLSRRGWIRYENGVPVEAVPPDKEHANLITFLYVALGVALVAGMLATRHSGML